MDNLVNVLSSCILFRNFSQEEIKEALKEIRYSISAFSRNEVVAIEGDNCTSIGIITKGSIEVQKIFESGKTMTIAKLMKGDIFGEVIIYSSMNNYPSTIVSSGDTEIMFISTGEVSRLCGLSPHFLNNFMGLLSSKILMLSKKLRNISYQTIRQKLSSYILDEHRKQKNTRITMSCSRKEMAEQLGIPRPSLSREMINMKAEGIIDFERNIIDIKDLGALEESLFG